ncbi:hypothetical protein, partial [Bathymodiolus thermophilus thioautotrophic gill symbiont]
MHYFLIMSVVFVLTGVSTINAQPSKQALVNINTEALIKILDEDASVVLIDVRAPFEIKHTGT